MTEGFSSGNLMWTLSIFLHSLTIKPVFVDLFVSMKPAAVESILSQLWATTEKVFALDTSHYLPNATYSAQQLHLKRITNGNLSVVIFSHSLICLVCRSPSRTHTQPSSLSIPPITVVPAMYCRSIYSLSERSAYPFKKNKRSTLAIHSDNVSIFFPSNHTKPVFA